MVSTRIRSAVAVTGAAILLAACGSSNSGNKAVTPGPVSAATTPAASASATPSAAAQASLAAVQGYWDYYMGVLAKPSSYDEASSRSYALADAGDALTNLVNSLMAQNLVFQGTAPTARLSVVSDSSTGQPPTVTIANCPTASGDWIQHNASTGATAPAPTRAGQAPSPWLTTYQVQDFAGKWVVASTKTDGTKTCSVQ